MPERRPNVLFVMDDQHSARCLGCYGNDDVRTPTIDGPTARGRGHEIVFQYASW